MMELNKDVNRRDQIVFGEPYNKSDYKFGGIVRFREMDLETLDTLFKENFIDPNETQNDSPTTLEIFEFMKAHPDFTCHGYAVSPERDDYRISIEGVEYHGELNVDMMIDFLQMFRFADSLQIDREELY